MNRLSVHTDVSLVNGDAALKIHLAQKKPSGLEGIRRGVVEGKAESRSESMQVILKMRSR